MTDEAILGVRVTPRSSRDEILGWDGDVLRVRLRAPPIQGRANEALRRLMADRLGLAPSAIQVAGGQTSRLKRLRMEGISPDEVRRRLDKS